MRGSIQTTSGAIFGALAAILAVLPINFPFPILPYLRFDFAEIPVIVALFLFGPFSGIVASIIYWGMLNFVGSFVPIGPALKFLAVISTVLGSCLGIMILSRSRRGTSMIGLLGVTLIFGAIVRIVVLTAANYAVLWIILPSFLDFAATSLAATVGVKLASGLETLQLALIVTAIYNALHIPLSMIPSYALVKGVLTRGYLRSLKEPWIVSILTLRSVRQNGSQRSE